MKIMGAFFLFCCGLYIEVSMIFFYLTFNESSDKIELPSLIYSSDRKFLLFHMIYSNNK